MIKNRKTIKGPWFLLYAVTGGALLIGWPSACVSAEQNNGARSGSLESTIQTLGDPFLSQIKPAPKPPQPVIKEEPKVVIEELPKEVPVELPPPVKPPDVYVQGVINGKARSLAIINGNVYAPGDSFVIKNGDKADTVETVVLKAITKEGLQVVYKDTLFTIQMDQGGK